MKRFLLILSSFLGAALMLHGQDMMQQLPIDPAVRTGKLDNGLTYFIRHNDKPEGRAEFYLATNVGAIQEAPDQDGLAHFLEHMCFNGTKNFPEKKLLDWLQSIGASFGGNVNAATGVEQTTYMLNNIPLVRQSVIDSCILIMHDYSHFVTNDPVEIDKERGVIIEERRARRNAGWRMHEKSLPYYFGDTKYAGCTLIGLQESLEGFKPESLVNFYKTWYRPDLQALIVIGDVDVDYVQSCIEKTFADIPAAENPTAMEVIPIPGNAEPLVGIITDPEATSVNLEVLWKSEADPEEMNNTIPGIMGDVMKSIISSVMSERFSDIAAKRDAPFLSASLGIGDLCETCEVVMGNVACKEGEAVPAFEAFLMEVEKMKRYGFTDDEVARAKDDLLSWYESAAKKKDTRKNAELVRPVIDHFFDNEPLLDPEMEYSLLQQLLPQISSQIINMVCPQLITDENLVVIYKAPEKAGLSHPSESDILDVIGKVRAAEIEAPAAEAVEKDFLDPATLTGGSIAGEASGLYGSTVWTLSNGIKVVALPTEYEKDRITFDIFKQGGQSLIATEDMPSFEESVWSLFLRNGGISRFPATTVTKMLSGKNVSVSPYIESISHGVSGTSTPKDLETAMQLLHLYFTDPRFDEDEYEQGVKTIGAILPNLVSQPQYKFQQEFYKTFYGGNERRVLLSPESMEKASLQTIERVYHDLFDSAVGATMVVVGDFEVAELKSLLEKYVATLPATGVPTRWSDRGDGIVKGYKINDFTADMQTPMTTVLQAYTAPMPFSFAKEIALDAASYILDMRYVTSLREDEGGTYGAHTATVLTTAPRQQAVLQIQFNAKPSSADRLRYLAAKGLGDLARSGPTDEEFAMTMKNLEKNLPERRITNRYWRDCLTRYELYGQNRDKDYEEALKSFTKEDVSKTLSEILATWNFLEVIMRPGSSAERE